MLRKLSIRRIVALTPEEIQKTPFSKNFLLLLGFKRPTSIDPALEAKAFSIFKRNPPIPQIEEALDDPVYFAEKKNRKAKLIFLTPSDYFKACAKNRGAGHTEATERAMLEDALVKKYLEAAKNGAKFPAPDLNLTNGNQEGRHRAAVAEILGIPYIPVFVFDFYKEPEKEV